MNGSLYANPLTSVCFYAEKMLQNHAFQALKRLFGHGKSTIFMS